MIVSAIGSASATASKPAAQVADASGFSDMLASFGRETMSALKAGEATGIAALEGKASVQEAVMSTLQAEQALQAAIAIRDKLVGALNDITRMQI
jgi:flagellar hook-basal body complex protein FliE